MLKLDIPARIHVLGKSYIIDALDISKIYSGDGEYYELSIYDIKERNTKRFLLEKEEMQKVLNQWVQILLNG